MARPGPIQYLSTSEDEQPVVTDKPKKRRRIGSKFALAKQARLSGHVAGPHCLCRRRCTEQLLSQEQRNNLLASFNNLRNRDEQDAYLSGLIRILPVHRRRMRCGNATPNDSSYKYFVRISRDEANLTNPDEPVQEVVICYKAFMSVHGVTNGRMKVLKSSLVDNGEVHVDKRGHHQNRPRNLAAADLATVLEHISSFRSRKSHYSRGQHDKLYLPEDLHVKVMFRMYSEKYNDSRASYNSYLKVFNTRFNISFGYPRCDTCSTCDTFLAQLGDIKKQITATNDVNEETELKCRKGAIKKSHELHKRKAETFYERKRAARQFSTENDHSMAIAMDYSKNLPVPNIQTNDVYYKRQLSLYSFNIHVLSTKASYFYAYDETVGKKGADDVASILAHFIATYVPPEVTELHIFCDSCAGQNKNYTIFRYLHSLVATTKRFETVKVTFPMRGHSYLECDKNMGLINQKARLETPNEWCTHISNSRKNPMPFVVVKCTREMFHGYTEFFKPTYKPICPFATRPVRDFMVLARNPKLIYTRNNFNGAWETYAVEKRALARPKRPGVPATLQQCYAGPLPIKKAKYDDLHALSAFCNQASVAFFKNLPFVGQVTGAGAVPDGDTDTGEDGADESD